MSEEQKASRFPSETAKTKAAGSALSAVLLPFRILGSAAIGIILSAILIVLMAWGTFVESEYGAPAAQFALYGSSWFSGLLGLLGVNLLCSIIARFPWKLRHIPFLLTHAGIIILLAGCVLTQQYGQTAQITLAEGTAGNTAVNTEKQQFTVRSASPGGADKAETLNIAFEPGPFNWNDYNRGNVSGLERRKYRDTLRLAMRWGHRQRGILAGTGKDIKVEVLDYLANSTAEPAAPLVLNVLWKNRATKITDDTGEMKEVPRGKERVSLQEARVDMSGGERVHYTAAQSPAEIESFLKGLPDEKTNFGVCGQLVLTYSGQQYFVNVDDLLQPAEKDKRFTVSGLPFEIGRVQFRARGPIISFTLYAPNGDTDRMTLFPDNPEMNVHARTFGVFGNYWVNPEKLSKGDVDFAASPMYKRILLPRLDVIQGTDNTLAFRVWTGAQCSDAAVVPEAKNGVKLTFFAAAGRPEEVEIVVENFEVQDVPGMRIVPISAGRMTGGQGKQEQRVKLNVSLDGKEETFWLRILNSTVSDSDQIHFIYGKDRTAVIQWNYAQIDLGFGIFLKQFDMRTEPGSKTASHYASVVDFVESSTAPSTSLAEDVTISMNQPASFQGKGRKYRIYQSSFQGPYHPNDPWFYEMYDGKVFPGETKPREDMFLSTFSINDDPGRGLKYLGCFLTIFGATLFIRRFK